MKELMKHEMRSLGSLTFHRYFSHSWLLIALISLQAIFGVGCTSEGIVDDVATIELSENGIITVEDGASTRDIQVQSSTSEWSCYSLNQWISAKNRDGVLELSFATNLSTDQRRGSVVVKAGRGQKQLTIIQAGTQTMVKSTPESLNVDQFGGEFSLDILSNRSDWQAYSAEEWISVESMPAAQKITVKVRPTTSRENRVGKVIITVGGDEGETYEVAVNQSGISYFILPYMNFENATRQDIQAFEEKRGGTIEFKHERFFNFTTTSIAFPRVSYSIYEGGAYLHAQLDASSTRILTGSAERRQLVDFLKASGFTTELDENTLQHETMTNLIVEIKPYYKNTPHLLFTYTPKQPKSYPTFDTLPLGFIRFDLGVEAVRAYEKENGGEEIYASDEEMEFACTPGKYEADGRIYFLHKDKEGKVTVERTRQFFYDTERACWNYKGYNNMLTEEFKALAKREGFEYVEYNILEQVYVFVSKEKNLTMAVQWFKFYGDPKPVLSVQINPGTRLVSHAMSLNRNNRK